MALFSSVTDMFFVTVFKAGCFISCVGKPNDFKYKKLNLKVAFPF